MSFSWPWALLALGVLPLVCAAWWLTRRSRRRAAVRVTSIALVAAAVPGRSRWRRRVPAGFLALGLAVLAVGAARPQATVAEPTSSATIMLTLDISGSMCSTDVKPNRITAAEQSAAKFIKSQQGVPRIGVVTFNTVATVLVPPTKDQQQLLGALPGLQPAGGTAIGDGILASLNAIAQVDPAVAPTGATVKRAPGAGYADDVIVVLTDGSNNYGVAPLTAAKEAAARGVRIYTIGYGTDTPAALVCNSGQFGGYFGGFSGGGYGGGGYGGGGGGGGAGNAFDANDTALQQVAAATGGKFFRAQDASQLDSALSKLPAAFTIVHRQVDLAAAFAGLGGLLIAAAVALSLRWNRVRRVASRAA